MLDLNLNSLTVDEATGRASFSGLSSGVDFQGAVDAIIGAKRIPIDRLETRVTENAEKITALEELRTALDAVRQSVSRLYGAVSFGGVNDIFQTKQAFASSSRSDGATPSAAANLLGVTVTNAAAAGSHSIEVLQTAAAHKVSSAGVSSLSDPLASLEAGDVFLIDAGLGYQSSEQSASTDQVGSAGTLSFDTIADATNLGGITYAATDTLDDIAANINANVTGVTAAVVASGAGVRLDITASGGDALDITETGAGTLLADLSVADKNQIAVTGSESMLDLRDLINNAGYGVTASIVSVSSAEHFLVLTKDDTGDPMVLRDLTGDALQTMDVLTAGGAIANQLQAAATAKFHADGLLDQSNTIYESNLVAAGTTPLGSSGTIEFRRDSDSSLIGSVTYSASDTLSDLAADITAISGMTGTVVTEGSAVRLEISGDEALGITESGAGTVLTDLGITNKRLTIERDSNTIADLFAGATLSLFQAEVGTTVKVEIERDLSSVKTEISNFVDSFNALKVVANTHRQFDATTGTQAKDSGVLFGSNALSEVNAALGQIVGQGVGGVSSEFSVLAQIGIEFVDNDTLEDPLLANTLEIDEATLDTALLNNAEDVRKLLSFNFETSDPRVTLLSFTGETSYTSGGYTLNVDPVAGTANIGGTADGADDGSASYQDGVVTILTGDAKGLKVLTSGFSVQTSVQVDLTTGFASEMFFKLGSLLDSNTGVVETEISNLTDENTLNEERVEEMLVRLEIQRQNLLDRFFAMETALATANRIMETLTQITDSMLAAQSN